MHQGKALPSRATECARLTRLGRHPLEPVTVCVVVHHGPVLTGCRPGGHDGDAMVVEGLSTSVATPESIAAGIEHQKLDAGRPHPTGSSTQNLAESFTRTNKRPNDPDEMSANPKKRKSPPPNSDDLSLLPDDVTDTDPADSVEVLDASSIHETFLEDDPSHQPPELLRDLETRAISVSQLIQEVKGIYAGLGT